MPTTTRERENRSIFIKTALLLALGALASLVAFGAWFEVQVRQVLAQNSEQIALAIVNAWAMRVRPLLLADDYDGLAGILRGIAKDSGALDILVAGPDGSVLCRVTRPSDAAGPIVEISGGRVDPPQGAGVLRGTDGQLQAWAQTGSGRELSWVRVSMPVAALLGRLDGLRRSIVVAAVAGGLMLLTVLLFPLARTYRMVERRETGLKAERDKLHHAVYHDRLTGLWNRAGLLERLERALVGRRAGDQLLAVCFLDLDGFKAVNDRYGHDIGDLLLVEVARRLSACVRQTDTVARLGGDEFVLLLEGESRPGEVMAIVEGVIARISQRVPAAGKPLHIGVSIGVAVRHAADDTADTLLKQADEAMYDAKRGGRNRWVLHQSSRGLLFNPPDASAPALA